MYMHVLNVFIVFSLHFHIACYYICKFVKMHLHISHTHHNLCTRAFKAKGVPKLNPIFYYHDLF